MIRWCGSMVSILIYVDSVSLCFSDVMVSLKNVLTNADTASNKLTLRLETKPLHILLRILDQETASPNISTSPNTERTSKTHLYHQSVGNTVIKCHKLCASTAPHQGGKSNNSKLMARITHATIKPGQAAQILFVF
jgi:hypothetical protein